MKTPKLSRHVRGILLIAIAALLAGLPVQAQQKNFLGMEDPDQIQTDPTQPVPRGYIVPRVAAAPGGATITVDIYHAHLDSEVSLWLQAAIGGGHPDPLPPGATDAPGNSDWYILNGQWFQKTAAQKDLMVVSLAQLSDKVIDNPTLYHSQREFEVNYDQLNQKLESLAPNAKGMKIGPGSPLFVYAKWHAKAGQGGWDHQWGGVERGGIIFMPEDPNAAPGTAQPLRANTKRPDELDLAFPIGGSLTAKYNDPATGAGLKKGGQVRSRVETEGKYQIPVDQYDAVKRALFDISNDPAKASAILGADWTIEAEMRYMKKNPDGSYVLDANNLPTPDPMVDTYYDNANNDAARKDMAIRYRWTEGNQSGSWNFKPGLTNASKQGLVTRTEYGLDTTDDKPETIEKFADSDNPLNFFKTIREVIPGATPSDFLKPAVKITDTRFKFLLRHKNGLAIEVSLDDVHAESLRIQGHEARYVQMEADVEHLATQSMNSATNYVSTLQHEDETKPENATWLSNLDGEAYLAGEPMMHTVDDVLPTSPVRMKHAEDFKLAEGVTVALRNHVIGKVWLPAPQKYALGVVEVGDLAKSEASPSVKRLYQIVSSREGDKRAMAAREATKNAGNANPSDVNGSGVCGGAFAGP